MTETSDLFTDEQRIRAKALDAARAVLVQRGILNSSEVRSVVNLITVAQWIIDGKDPWPIESDVDANPAEDSMTVRGPDGQARYTVYHDRVEEAHDAELRDEPTDESVEADR